MIQRIQTLYLILGVVAVVLMFFFPFAVFDSAGAEFSLSAAGLKGDTELAPPAMVMLLTAMVGILGILLIATIMAYKDRRKQMKVLLFAMLANLALVGVGFLAVGKVQELSPDGTAYSYQLSTYLVLVILILIVMANRGIRSDEAKVRAADRLR